MYNIYLSITDQITGCQNTDSIPVELWTRPISEFSITDFTCGPDTLQIVNNSQFAMLIHLLTLAGILLIQTQVGT